MSSVMEAKAAVGNVTVDVGQVIRNLTGVETDREKKSFLQQIMEPEEVDDGSRDAKKAEKIARKIARGESVTPEEKAFLMKFDPKLAQLAELARKEGERIKHSLEQASTKKEQQNVLHQAYQMVAQVSKKNPQFGALLGEAVKAAVEDGRKKGYLKEEGVEDCAAGEVQNGPARTSGVAAPVGDSGLDGQYELLEQFLPEEASSVMDYRG